MDERQQRQIILNDNISVWGLQTFHCEHFLWNTTDVTLLPVLPPNWNCGVGRTRATEKSENKMQENMKNIIKMDTLWWNDEWNMS